MAPAPRKLTNAAVIESALQRLVTVYVITGLVFMLLPGTFLGVWNLVSISGRHALGQLSPAWLQASLTRGPAGPEPPPHR